MADKSKKKEHEFGLDYRGELDEVFVRNAFVHVERMSRQCYWIGIYGEGMSPLRIFTGQHRGTWFFNLADDRVGGNEFIVKVVRRKKRRRN